MRHGPINLVFLVDVEWQTSDFQDLRKKDIRWRKDYNPATSLQYLPYWYTEWRNKNKEEDNEGFVDKGVHASFQAFLETVDLVLYNFS